MTAMRKLLQIPAYIWAVLCLLLIPVTFIGSQTFAERLAQLPFMKVNPIYSGGEVVRTIEDQGLKTEIYNPVFEALFGENSRGFVQIRLSSADSLPAKIEREIDYDNDTTADFTLYVNTLTGETKIEPVNNLVTGVTVSSPVKEAWVVRVGLKNPSKHH
jgi:hypothetical protein